MMTEDSIAFKEIIDALLDADSPFPPKYLYRFSDIKRDDLEILRIHWADIPLWNRRALLEDVEELALRDTMLSFEDLARFAVEDTDPHVRMLAVQTLWEYESSDLASLFIRLLREDRDSSVRTAAAAGLGRFVFAGELDKIPEQILSEVEDCLLAVSESGGSEPERQKALISLGYSSRVEVTPLIESAYRSADPGWIAAALNAMGHSLNERWIPVVM